MIGLTGTSRLLKALGDENRMRILNLLAQEELSGTDLMEVLNMGQSRVSTHLTLLKEVGLVADRRAGRRSYYSIQPGPAAGFWEDVQRANERSPEFETDAAGLEALRERRRGETRAYFDRVAASFGDQLLPGRTWEGLARALTTLLNDRNAARKIGTENRARAVEIFSETRMFEIYHDVFNGIASGRR